MADAPLWQRYRTQLEALQNSTLNFDLEKRHEYTTANGWRVDSYDADLPPEPPGPPLPNGSWRIAQQIVREYRFPDPSLITGIFIPDQPLEQRVMLLEGKFLWFRFFFGVRIGGVTDEVRDTKEGPIHVWGYNYQTLQGHFEEGQIEFTILKHATTGAVVFHIDAFSHTGHISNLFYRLGFKLFGRRLQLRFAHTAMARMQQLVKEQLTQGPQTTSTSDGPPVQAASASPAAQEAMADAQSQAAQAAADDNAAER